MCTYPTAKESILLTALDTASDCIENSAANPTVSTYRYVLECIIDYAKLYHSEPNTSSHKKLKCSQREIFKLAYARPNPHGLVFKLTARTVHAASKLAVWATAAETTPPRADKAAADTAKQVERLAVWAAMSQDMEIGTCWQVYEPAEDSFLLADAALAELAHRDKYPAAVLELGCGTGIISRIIGQSTDAKVTAADINPHATACARLNGIDAIRSDLFQNIEGTYDLILFNPPYLPDEPEERTGDWLDTALFAGPSGRDAVIPFLKGAGQHLNENGTIMIVISSETWAEKVKRKAEQFGYRTAEGMEFEKLRILEFQKEREEGAANCK